MFDIDWMYLCVCLGLVFTGAAFFGYPLGWAVAKRTFHREIEYLPISNQLDQPEPPTIVKEAKRRLQRSRMLSREDAILLADHLEEK